MFTKIEENHVKFDDLVYDNSRKQSGRNSEGYYEKNLICTNTLEAYDSIIQEQRANEFIEKVKVEELNETVSERVSILSAA